MFFQTHISATRSGVGVCYTIYNLYLQFRNWAPSGWAVLHEVRPYSGWESMQGLFHCYLHALLANLGDNDCALLGGE